MTQEHPPVRSTVGHDVAARAFHVMAKPSGSTCNIDCKYCYFLSKDRMYPEQRQRMSAQTLESYLKQLLEAHSGSQVTVAWQGGEPTLMGLDFFRQALDIVERLRRPDQQIEHTFQTNGIALDKDWCSFFRANKILVGLSVDGPRDLHDANRVTRSGTGSFDLVMKGWRALRKYGVDFNILCTVNSANQAHGRRVYRFLKDELGARFIQFIPIVERADDETIAVADLGWNPVSLPTRRPLYRQAGNRVVARSVSAEGYGQFLVDVFEDWVRHDVGKVFVQLFDVTLEAYFGRHTLCVHAPTCGRGLALEFNGDLFSCDHFVEPEYRLGNIHERHLLDLASSPRQLQFGASKRSTLTRQCSGCPVLHLCNGGCPKDRFTQSVEGEPGQNYLCAGLRRFFLHVDPAMTRMANLLAQGKAPSAVKSWMARTDKARLGEAGCTCGRRVPFRECHGRPAARGRTDPLRSPPV